VPEKAIVNTKAVYAAGGGIAVVAIAIFFIFGQGNFKLPGVQDNQNSAQNQTAPDMQLSVKDVIVKKQDDKNAQVQVVFSAFNPNKSTLTLETISYTLKVGQFKVVSGDIGVSPEGFLSGQPDTYTIVPGSTVILKEQTPPVFVRNNLTANTWDSVVNGTAKYTVEGHYALRLIGSNFQTNYGDKDFALTFP